MRERIAVALSVSAAVLLVTLSAVFAASQNAAPENTAPENTAPENAGSRNAASQDAAPEEGVPAQQAASDSIRGHAVFAANGCMRCHSVGGEGNARNPLDGVGARRTPAELRAWTVGAEVVADSLPPSAFRAKQAFQRIPEEELRQLIAYVSSLKRPREGG